MAKRQIDDYRHEDASRKNNPPAGIAPTYEAREHLQQGKFQITKKRGSARRRSGSAD